MDSAGSPLQEGLLALSLSGQNAPASEAGQSTRSRIGIRVPREFEPWIDPATWGTIVDHEEEGEPVQGRQLTGAFMYHVANSLDQGSYGKGLWEDLRNIFEYWPLEAFQRIPAVPMTRIKHFLNQEGILLRFNGERIAPQLHAELSRADYPLWTEQDVKSFATKDRSFRERIKDPEFYEDLITPPEPIELPTRSTPKPMTAASISSSELRQTVPKAPWQTPPEAPEHRHPPTVQQLPARPQAQYPRQDTRPSAAAQYQQREWPHQRWQPDARSSEAQDPRSAPAERSRELINGHPERQQDARWPIDQRSREPTDTPSNAQPITARQYTDLGKMYASDDMDKYTGGPYDLLDSKIKLFRERCEIAQIADHQLVQALPIALKGEARVFYYDVIKESAVLSRDYGAALRALKTQFETPQLQAQYVREWHAASLEEVVRKYPDKSLLECFNELDRNLQRLRRVLHHFDRTDAAMRQRLIAACCNIPQCRVALFNPADNLPTLRSQIRNAITLAAAPTEQLTLSSDAHYWTDRTYRGNGREARFGRGRSAGAPRPRPAAHQANKECFVCGKGGCWSTQHTAEERRKARESFQKLNKSFLADAFVQWLEDDDGEGAEYTAEDEMQRFQAEIGKLQSTEEHPGEAPATHFVSNTYFASQPIEGPEIAKVLMDQSALHALTKHDPTAQRAQGEAATFTLEGRYSAQIFQGIMPDTGASTNSTAGKPQFHALQRALPDVRLNKERAGEIQIRFGPGEPLSSLGTTVVPTPLGPITFHVIDRDTPFLLCLRDMDEMGVQFDNLRNQLIQGTLRVPVTRKWGHPWLLLERERAVASNHLTEVELRRVHRRFGHPSVYKLHRLLAEAGHPTELSSIKQLNKMCQQCQLHDPRPSRFKFTLKDDPEFNYEVIADIFYLEGNLPVLHVVDQATAFTAARFLPDVTAKSTWEALRLCWIDVYQGPPDILRSDAGPQFHAAEFKESASAMGTIVREMPIEAHNSIGKVERGHAPLRRAYEVLRADDPLAPRDLSLQMAVKAVNDTSGPNGLVPTLLVFGAYPRINNDSPPSASITRRAAALRKAMDEVRKVHAKRQLSDALAMRNGPNTSSTLDLPINSRVRVYREKEGWKGPYKLLATEGQTCVIETPAGPRDFRITSVKPFHIDERTQAAHPKAAEEPPPAARTTARFELIEPPELPTAEIDEPIATFWRPQIFLSSKERADQELAVALRAQGILVAKGEPFEESTQQEITALIERGVFEFCMYDPKLHGNTRIFKSRIVNEVKGKGTDTPYEKSRLVIQGYADDGKEVILCQAPTILRASQRLILALSPSMIKDGKIVWLRDISQAYTQSTTKLNRTILAQLPAQIKHLYPTGTLMVVIKPLYGIAEAGTHWWATYSRHHREKLQMGFSTFDPCLLITSAASKSFAMVGMQTDDTIAISDAEFDALEEHELINAGFEAKPKQYLREAADPLAFNGGMITLNDGVITLKQKGQGTKIELIDASAPDAKQRYVEQRARGAYIASICQPEACFDLSTAAQRQDPTPADIKALNERLQWQINSLERGLTFIPLDLSTAKLFIFADGSFANNPDSSSQLGFLIVLANEEPLDSKFTLRGSIVHFSSIKSKRVTRSVLASEVYGMVAGVDIGYALGTTLKLVTDRLALPEIPTIICTDSYSLYECLVKLGSTQEKRLMIDILALRQSYERRELYEIRWINGNDNPADALTKAKPNSALERLIDTSELEVRMEGWVSRL